MNVKRLTGALASIAATALSACAITSEGLEFTPDREGVQALATFSWHGIDDLSGTMTASFPDGRLFSGSYVWITAETQPDLLEPLWQGWTGNHGWRHWEPGPDFVQYYRGDILATLSAANGERMRCRFKAGNRSSGMSGGGQGTCQFADGNSFDASFAPG